MRRLLRRSDKSDASRPQSSNLQPSRANATPRKTNFFDLPAEIRNDIYERLARETTLHLSDSPSIVTSNNTKLKKSVLIPGLLLASRQCRAEYSSILLSTAQITAVAIGYDFKFVSRIAGSLYRSELKALRENPNLKIVVRLKRPSSQTYVQLRRWCIERANSLDRLPWRYVIEGTSGLEQCRWWCEQAKVLFERAEVRFLIPRFGLRAAG